MRIEDQTTNTTGITTTAKITDSFQRTQKQRYPFLFVYPFVMMLTPLVFVTQNNLQATITEFQARVTGVTIKKDIFS